MNNLSQLKSLKVKQIKEWGEILVDFETRNKYSILDESDNSIGFAAEQGKGFLALIGRQFFGHWRTFEVHIFDNQKQVQMIGLHPFRWWFQRFEVRSSEGENIGALQQRFSLLTKKFDVEDSTGNAIMTVASPLWKLWTFSFIQRNREVAVIKKKWSGLLKEAFSDADNYTVEFTDPMLDENAKKILLASTIFIDLQYFENKN